MTISGANLLDGTQQQGAVDMGTVRFADKLTTRLAPGGRRAGYTGREDASPTGSVCPACSKSEARTFPGETRPALCNRHPFQIFLGKCDFFLMRRLTFPDNRASLDSGGMVAADQHDFQLITNHQTGGAS